MKPQQKPETMPQTREVILDVVAICDDLERIENQAQMLARFATNRLDEHDHIGRQFIKSHLELIERMVGGAMRYAMEGETFDAE
jgi:hypothetical protein